MTEFKVGDKVRIKDTHPLPSYHGRTFVIEEIREVKQKLASVPFYATGAGFECGVLFKFLEHVSNPVEHPNYYVMPDGNETVGITNWLNSAGAQAVQYIVRSTRIDGVVKDNPIQDIDKAIYWLNIERERLGGDGVEE